MQRSFKPQNTGQYRGGPPFFASPQQPAGSLCKKTEPGQHRREAPYFIAPVAQLSERSSPKAVVAGEIPAGSTSLRSVELRLGRPISGEWFRGN